MKTIYKVLTLFTLALLSFSCSSDSDDVVPDSPDPEDGVQSNAFIEELLRLGQRHSINRNIIDWEQGRNRVYKAFNEEGRRTAIFEFLSILDDNHSFYQSGNSFIYAGSGCRGGGSAYQFDLPPEIGYVQVNAVSGMDIGFAETIQREISRQNTAENIGWVVDLSQNGGGNMYPMLAGVSPLLDDGIIGYFIDPDNEQISWEQNRGVISVMGNAVISMSRDIELINPEAKIAVIVGRNTASSGEATLISFLGSERVRTFGEPSCGLSTANQGFNLSDGGALYLTVSTMADRNKTLYGEMVAPDVEVSNSEELNQAIIDWVTE
ncbi:MAG: S41 family peptidase [Bacteroidota bacterium]